MGLARTRGFLYQKPFSTPLVPWWSSVVLLGYVEVNTYKTTVDQLDTGPDQRTTVVVQNMHF